VKLAWLLALAGCGAVASGPEAHRSDRPLVRDGDFELPAFDSGTRKQRCVVEAARGAWGIEASTFSDRSNHALALSRFQIAGGEAHLYGEESDGRWGFVRYVQGDVWGGTNCGPIPWNRAIDVALSPDATIELRVFREKSKLTSRLSSWLMFAVNLWFSAPSFPPGKDKQHKKPLVMDLIFHHQCNSPFCGPRHYVDEAAHHYQESVGTASFREWVTLEIPVGRHLRAALERFDLPGEGVSLQQVEVLIELRHAEGAMRIDDFQLWQ